jgi:hypothetical protein
MTETTDRPAAWSPLDFWRIMMPPGVGETRPGRGAPDTLVQPILPGWSFMNLILNERNSRSPDTEISILREASYGRQLGRLINVVDALLDRADKASFTGKDAAAVRAFLDLRETIEAAKERARPDWLSEEGMTDLAEALDALRTKDPALHGRLCRILRRAVGAGAA